MTMVSFEVNKFKIIIISDLLIRLIYQLNNRDKNLADKNTDKTIYIVSTNTEKGLWSQLINEFHIPLLDLPFQPSICLST